MRLSIRIRMLVAMNLLVVAVGVVVGWVGIRVAGTEIERKLLDEPVSNAAGLVGQMNLPLTNDWMTRLQQILGAEVAAGPVHATTIVATSLEGEDPRRGELQRQLADAVESERGRQRRPVTTQAAGPLTVPDRITLGGKAYRLAWAPLPGLWAQTGRPGDTVYRRAARPSGRPDGAAGAQAMRLYLLVPAERVDAAKREVAGTIAWVTFAAVAAATLLGIWLSTSISRPVRRLARHMDRLAGQAAQADLPAGGPADVEEPTARQTIPRGAPPELVHLAESFDQLLQTLSEARERLAQSARLAALGKLSASVAHELRNPLSGLKMNARVLADELARAGVSDRSLELIIREIDRMDLYLQELLSLGAAPGEAEAAEAGEPSACRLDELAESVVSLLEGRCEHAGVTVEKRFDPAGREVRAEAAQVRQVILNLMINALDAMPAGGRIELAAARGEGGAVRFSVRDTGPGVSVADEADIFEPFVTTKPAGAGLGLHVCRQIIARHGGRIGYDSTPQGSTFWFELPGAATQGDG